MDNKEIIAMVEEAMELEEGDLKEDSTLEDFEEWDSLSKLSLLALVKRNYNKVISADQLREFKTVADICEKIKEED